MAEFSGEDLVCVRGERTVFANLSFQLTSGGVLILAGPNGAGKSSLLRMMAGLLPPAAGVLAWDGAPVTDDPEAHRRRVRYVAHADAVKSALTVAENLRTWAVLWGGPAAEERGGKALADFGIDRLADVPGRYLSAGQKRRLALARLLVAPAALWLLDEPRAGLDTDAERRLDRAIRTHRDGGRHGGDGAARRRTSGGRADPRSHRSARGGAERHVHACPARRAAVDSAGHGQPDGRRVLRTRLRAVPLGVGPEPQTLSRIASGIICVAALLAAMLSLERLFQSGLRRRLAGADGAVAAAARGRRPRQGRGALADHRAAADHRLAAACDPAAPRAARFPALVAALAIATPSLSLIGAVGAPWCWARGAAACCWRC